MKTLILKFFDIPQKLSLIKIHYLSMAGQYFENKGITNPTLRRIRANILDHLETKMLRAQSIMGSEGDRMKEYSILENEIEWWQDIMKNLDCRSVDFTREIEMIEETIRNLKSRSEEHKASYNQYVSSDFKLEEWKKHHKSILELAKTNDFEFRSGIFDIVNNFFIKNEKESIEYDCAYSMANILMRAQDTYFPNTEFEREWQLKKSILIKKYDLFTVPEENQQVWYRKSIFKKRIISH